MSQEGTISPHNIRRNGTTWQSATLFITGDTIVDGTITATELQISSTDGTNAAGIHMDGQ